MQLFSNNADSSLYGSIAANTTVFTVKTGDGAKFPSPSGGDFFLLTLFQRVGTTEINHEIVKCTGRAGDSLTVVRAQEGTVAKAFTSGDLIELRVTAGTLDNKVEKVAGKSLSTEDFSSAEKTKLAGIATGATANSTDAQLRDRATHTGTQAISTVSGLQAALDAKANSSHAHATADITGLQTALDSKQPFDADLTAIAALTGTSGLLKKTAADTWSLDTNTYLTDAPSDGKTYGRKNSAWVEVVAGGDSYQVGDVHIGTRPPVAGTWLEMNNGIYLQSSYADLYAQLGLIQNSPGTFNTFSAITMASSAPSTETWSSIAEGKNGVAVAISNGTTGNRFARTTDGGQTWTSVIVPINLGYWVKVVYGNGTFVALNGRGTIVYSTNGGVTWGSSALTIVDTGYSWVDIAFGGGYFVAIRSGTTVTNRSTNGISWSVAASPTAAFTSVSKVAYGNGAFVTFSGTDSYRSTDGANSWGSAVAMYITVTHICFGNGLFVATNGGSAITSPTGVSWSATKTVTPSIPSINSFSFGNGLFYMTNATVGVGSWNNFDTTFTSPTPTGLGIIGCSAFINSSIIVLRDGPTASRAFIGINYNPSSQFTIPAAIAPDIKSWIKAIL